MIVFKKEISKIKNLPSGENSRFKKGGFYGCHILFYKFKHMKTEVEIERKILELEVEYRTMDNGLGFNKWNKKEQIQLLKWVLE